MGVQMIGYSSADGQRSAIVEPTAAGDGWVARLYREIEGRQSRCLSVRQHRTMQQAQAAAREWTA